MLKPTSGGNGNRVGRGKGGDSLGQNLPFDSRPRDLWSGVMILLFYIGLIKIVNLYNSNYKPACAIRRISSDTIKISPKLSRIINP
jgi:hypothetical protein